MASVGRCSGVQARYVLEHFRKRELWPRPWCSISRTVSGQTTGGPNKVRFQPGWEVSSGSWSCENVLREHLRFAGNASSGCVT
jgi:hypothetical protein